MSNYLKPQSPIYNKGNDSYIYPLTTSDQVIMPNGRRLDKEGLESMVTPEGIGAMSMELLWENASPDSSMANGTTITGLPLSNYDMYAILFKYLSGQPFYLPLHVMSCGLHCYANYAGSSGQVVSRSCLYRPNYIELRDSYVNNVVDNSTMIPYRIYGIKGVK